MGAMRAKERRGPLPLPPVEMAGVVVQQRLVFLSLVEMQTVVRRSFLGVQEEAV